MPRAHAILGAARFMSLLSASVADTSQRTRMCPSAMRSPRTEKKGYIQEQKWLSAAETWPCGKACAFTYVNVALRFYPVTD
jgi:hypothetical protein